MFQTRPELPAVAHLEMERHHFFRDILQCIEMGIGIAVTKRMVGDHLKTLAEQLGEFIHNKRSVPWSPAGDNSNQLDLISVGDLG